VFRHDPCRIHGTVESPSFSCRFALYFVLTSRSDNVLFSESAPIVRLARPGRATAGWKRNLVRDTPVGVIKTASPNDELHPWACYWSSICYLLLWPWPSASPLASGSLAVAKPRLLMQTSTRNTLATRTNKPPIARSWLRTASR